MSHQDNLEFLEDIVPKTVPYKKVKASAAATQARLRGEKTVQDGSKPPATSNGNSKGKVLNGGTHKTDEKMEDPNDQLELEMRQAAGANRDGDVAMTG